MMSEYNMEIHPHYAKANKLMQSAQKHFPRRHFYLEVVLGVTVIRVKNSFVSARVSGGKSILLLAPNYANNVYLFNFVDRLETAFDKEAAYRKASTHQKQQLKAWVVKLCSTEMLKSEDLRWVIEMPIDHADPYPDEDRAPSITFAWQGIAETVIARIDCAQYTRGLADTPKFVVTFGGESFQFNTFAEVLSFFNGNDVFKVLDSTVTNAAFAEVHTYQRAGGLTGIMIKAEDLVRCTPHLLLMESTFNVQWSATILPNVHNEGGEVIRKAMQFLLWKRKHCAFYEFEGYAELQWKFDYAPVEVSNDTDSGK